ncbi:hypothetical protein PGT21_002164 [Puccinia graminis f. sp. tritici]|uniref:Uncharacterized protein n=1 Tax=Puccinia graminis f. sp. tritici TaxID=56615 RepID=A0A5B0LHV9_PUCGR|nr:hypothetical protein PGT21_002164 [Puccinia graminis f. sp. tritici]
MGYVVKLLPCLSAGIFDFGLLSFATDPHLSLQPSSDSGHTIEPFVLPSPACYLTPIATFYCTQISI